MLDILKPFFLFCFGHYSLIFLSFFLPKLHMPTALLLFPQAPSQAETEPEKAPLCAVPPPPPSAVTEMSGDQAPSSASKVSEVDKEDEFGYSWSKLLFCNAFNYKRYWKSFVVLQAYALNEKGCFSFIYKYCSFLWKKNTVCFSWIQCAFPRHEVISLLLFKPTFLLKLTLPFTWGADRTGTLSEAVAGPATLWSCTSRRPSLGLRFLWWLLILCLEIWCFLYEDGNVVQLLR